MNPVTVNGLLTEPAQATDFMTDRQAWSYLCREVPALVDLAVMARGLRRQTSAPCVRNEWLTLVDMTAEVCPHVPTFDAVIDTLFATSGYPCRCHRCGMESMMLTNLLRGRRRRDPAYDARRPRADVDGTSLGERWRPLGYFNGATYRRPA